jgi:hypothetical protein
MTWLAPDERQIVASTPTTPALEPGRRRRLVPIHERAHFPPNVPPHSVLSNRSYPEAREPMLRAGADVPTGAQGRCWLPGPQAAHPLMQCSYAVATKWVSGNNTPRGLHLCVYRCRAGQARVRSSAPSSSELYVGTLQPLVPSTMRSGVQQPVLEWEAVHYVCE